MTKQTSESDRRAFHQRLRLELVCRQTDIVGCCNLFGDQLEIRRRYQALRKKWEARVRPRRQDSTVPAASVGREGPLRRGWRGGIRQLVSRTQNYDKRKSVSSFIIATPRSVLRARARALPDRQIPDRCRSECRAQCE